MAGGEQENWGQKEISLLGVGGGLRGAGRRGNRSGGRCQRRIWARHMGRKGEREVVVVVVGYAWILGMYAGSAGSRQIKLKIRI